MNEFPLYWNFGPLFFCKLLQVIRIWRMPSPNCCFEISHRCSMGFRSGLIVWPFHRTLQCLFCKHFWVLFEFRVIVLLEEPWPLVETQLSDTGHYVAITQNSLVIIRFHDTVQTVRGIQCKSKTSLNLHHVGCRDCLLFFEALNSFRNSTMNLL